MHPDWTSSVRLLCARRLLQFDGKGMPSFGNASALAWRGDCDLGLVLFISHRWRSTSQPDPDGRTLQSIQRLIGALDALARGLDPQDPAPTPSLQEPGMLSASILLYRLLERCELDGARVLDQVGIFFDFSCLPQGDTQAEQERLKQGLACLPTMVPDRMVTLVAIREPKDEYAARAWCVAESVLSLQYDEARPWIYTFPLRFDLEAPPSPTFEPLKTAIERWSEISSGRSSITQGEFRDWLRVVQLCVDWHDQAKEEAKTSLHHSPDVADLSFRLWIATTTRLAEGGAQVLDVGPIVSDVIASAGFRCTNPADLLPTALIILSGLRWEELNRKTASAVAPFEPIGDFWRLCFLRYVEGRPLMAEVQPHPPSVDGRLTLPTLKLIAL